jgi:hypothetical protein
MVLAFKKNSSKAFFENLAMFRFSLDDIQYIFL